MSVWGGFRICTVSHRMALCLEGLRGRGTVNGHSKEKALRPRCIFLYSGSNSTGRQEGETQLMDQADIARMNVGAQLVGLILLLRVLSQVERSPGHSAVDLGHYWTPIESIFGVSRIVLPQIVLMFSNFINT